MVEFLVGKGIGKNSMAYMNQGPIEVTARAKFNTICIDIK